MTETLNAPTHRIPSSDRLSNRSVTRYPDRLSERHLSERQSDRLSEQLPQRLSDRHPDRHSSRVSERHSDRLSERHSDRRNTRLDFAEVSPLPQTLPDLKVAGGELAKKYLCECIRLDWEDLQCFEVVNHQFQEWGVAFGNAIALRPSNPAYPPYSGVMVLMGAPKEGWLETTFSQPVRFVSGFITSSRRTVLTAFDKSDRVVGKTESAGANLANSQSSRVPNVQLSLHAPNIHRITFHAFDGHLTLDDFCFGF